jgi:Tfp pilus assembly protein PilO
VVRGHVRLSARSLRAVLALVSCSILIGAWQTWLAPERLFRDAARSRLAAAIAEIDKLRQTTGGLIGLRREVRSLEIRLESAEGAQEPSDHAGHILEVANAVATESGLALTSFSGGRASPDGKAARIALEVEGGYQQVVAFVADLIGAGRIASIHEIAIKPIARPDARRAVTATLVAEPGTGTHTIALDDAVFATGRDPFVASRRTGGTVMAGDGRAPATGPAPARLEGIAIDDVAVTGIVRAGEVSSATLQTSDRRTFVVRPHQRLLDGTIQSIDLTGVVFFRHSSSAQVRKAIGASNGGVR